MCRASSVTAAQASLFSLGEGRFQCLQPIRDMESHLSSVAHEKLWPLNLSQRKDKRKGTFSAMPITSMPGDGLVHTCVSMLFGVWHVSCCVWLHKEVLWY